MQNTNCATQEPGYNRHPPRQICTAALAFVPQWVGTLPRDIHPLRDSSMAGEQQATDQVMSVVHTGPDNYTRNVT
eukprot:12262255-Heterocapsa_arctica.AAC.1